MNAEQPPRGVVDALDVIAAIDDDQSNRHTQQQVLTALPLLPRALPFLTDARQFDNGRDVLAGAHPHRNERRRILDARGRDQGLLALATVHLETRMLADE